MSDELNDYWDNLFGVGNDNGGSGNTPAPIDWGAIGAAAGAALNTGANYLSQQQQYNPPAPVYQYPTVPQPQQFDWYDGGVQGLLQGAGSIVDWFSKPQPAPAYQDQTPYQLPQPQANPWNFNSSDWYTPPPRPADVATFYGQESTANQSPGSVADFNSIESGYKPSFAAPVDPNALDYNPEKPFDSYADWYSKNNPKGIVEAYQRQAKYSSNPNPAPVRSDDGSPADFYQQESESGVAPKTADPFYNDYSRNPAELFGPVQQHDFGQDIGNVFGGINQTLLGGIQAAGSAIRPIGETANYLADSGIPGVSQAAQVARGVYTNWTEPILSTGISVAGDLLKPAAEAVRGKFDEANVTKELTQKKIALEQQIYDQAIKAGYSDAEASAQAQRLEGITSYQQLMDYPMQVPGVLANVGREIFDRDNLTTEFTQKKIGYIQDARDQAIAAGASPDQADKIAQQLDQKLGNFANLSEYEGLQKFGTFPALAQLGIMFFDPVGNFGANAIARPIMSAAGEVAGKVTEIPAVRAAGDFIAGPQKRGYAAEGAVQQLIPALEDHANVSGIPFTDLAKEFATNPNFRESLGYTASRETDALANTMGQKLDDVYNSLPPNPNPTFPEIVAANKEAFTEYRFNQNINSNRFADEAAALADAEQRADRQFAKVTNQVKLGQVQKAFPGLDQRAGEILDASDQALMQQKFQAAVTPEGFREGVNNSLQLQTGAAKVNKATGEIVPTRPLEQFGPVAGTILRGPGAVTNSFLARLWLNGPGRLVRDPMTNILKGGMEGVNPFGSRKTTAAVDNIGLTRPEFTEGLSGDVGKKFADNPAGKAVFTYLNAPGELTGSALHGLSKLPGNPLNVGADVNRTTGLWEASVKKNIWEAKAVENFQGEAVTAANKLGQHYQVQPQDTQELLSNGKLTNKQLKDFANNNVPTGQAKQFVKDVAAARADLRIQAGTFATKEMDRMFFSYKKNILEQTLGGFAPFSYWPVQNLRYLAGYLANHPYEIAALSNFLDQNQEQNRKAGVPQYARNAIMLGQAPNGEQKLWNWQNSLPFAMPNNILTDSFATVASGDRDYSATPAPKAKGDIGSYLFGSEGTNGARNKGLIPTLYQLNPALDFFTKQGWVNQALRELGAVNDNFGSPGPKDKQALNLFNGESIWMSAAAALGWPIDLLRKAGIVKADFGLESYLNSIAFGPNAGKPISKVQEELAVMVQNGQLTPAEGKQALISIKNGTWNAASRKALDKVEGETLPAKLLSFLGIPTTTVNTPRDQYNEEIRPGYAAVKDDKGRYVDVVKYDKSGKPYTVKEFQEGASQKFFKDNPGAEVLFDANKTPEQINQQLKDDVTRQAITDLYKKRDDKTLSQRDFYSELDKLQQANPEYFKAQTQTKLGKASGEKPLLPGESEPKILTPAEEARQREYSIKTDEYKNLTPGFDTLQQRAYALKDAGDTKGYTAIVSSPEYKQGQAKQLAYIEQNPSWFAQYQANLAKEGFTTKSVEDRRYSEKLDEYYSIGGSKFDDLSKQVSDLMNAGDKKGAGKIISNPEYKAAKAAQQDYLNRNPDFATRFKAEYAAKNGKEMATQADNTYTEKLNAYQEIGGEAFDFLSQQQQDLRNAGNAKAANVIFLSSAYQDVQKSRDQYLKDNPDFAAAYFEKYPSAKTAFDKRQAGGSRTATSTTGAGSSSNRTTSSYSSSSYKPRSTYSTPARKPFVPYTAAQKRAYAQSQNGRAFTPSSGSSTSDWNAAQKRAYGQAIQAGKSKTEAAAIASKLMIGGSSSSQGNQGSQHQKQVSIVNVFSRPGQQSRSATGSSSSNYYPTTPGKPAASTTTTGGNTTATAPWNQAQKQLYAKLLGQGKTKAYATAAANNLGKQATGNSFASSQAKSSYVPAGYNMRTPYRIPVPYTPSSGYTRKPSAPPKPKLQMPTLGRPKIYNSRLG
jgi:hypothetical protein